MKFLDSFQEQIYALFRIVNWIFIFMAWYTKVFQLPFRIPLATQPYVICSGCN